MNQPRIIIIYNPVTEKYSLHHILEDKRAEQEGYTTYNTLPIEEFTYQYEAIAAYEKLTNLMSFNTTITIARDKILRLKNRYTQDEVGKVFVLNDIRAEYHVSETVAEQIYNEFTE